MTSPNLMILDETASTNSYLMQLLDETPTLPQLYSVVAKSQTAGRGQRGNAWVATPGQNLTFSYLLRPSRLKAHSQYVVSELAALSLVKTVARYLSAEAACHLSIKWPNDIYYRDRKLAGILIEHSITGEFIDHSVIGIGLNLNERDFPDDLPNPISLTQITGQTYDPLEVHARLMRRLGFMLEDFMLANYTEVHRDYMERLYRREGMHPYHDSAGAFMAHIEDVLPSGQIVLMRENGEVSTYGFKEVIFDAD